MRIEVIDGNGNKRKFSINDVLYVPKIGENLVSVSSPDRKGMEVRCKNGRFEIIDQKNDKFATGILSNGLYVLNVKKNHG